jgi:hypothetical protein
VWWHAPPQAVQWSGRHLLLERRWHVHCILAAGPWAGSTLQAAEAVTRTGADQPGALNAAGLTIMAVSILGILILLVSCYCRVLRLPRPAGEDR